MSLILSGTDGLSDVDGSAATPAIRGTDANTGIFFPAADTIAFAEGGAEVARFDSSGNFGLGVTPSAGSVHMDISNGGSVYGLGTGSQLVGNSYFSGGWFYRGSGKAARIDINNSDSGGMSFNVASASGTAGNAITFTQAMTLDASGNLGVGTTSPTYKITVKGGNANNLLVDNDGSQYTQLLMQRNSTANTGGDLLVDGTNGLMSLRMLAVGSLRFCTSASAGDGTERARIDSSGRLLVNGTSSSSSTAYMQTFVNGGNGATGYIGMFHSGSNLANQTAGYMIGKTDLTMYSSYDGVGNPRNNIYLTSVTNGVYLAANGTSWTALSDARKKDIIEPISDAANKVSTLRAVIGKYKTDEDGTRRSFLIAQDVQAVLPEAVDANDPENLGVQYSDVIPLLVAAIKEQQALITQLTDRITALENK